MLNGSNKANEYLLRLRGYFKSSDKFSWSEYFFPSTLKLNAYIDILLEPIKEMELFAKTKLGLQEALVNAVCHGNGKDPDKKIRVRRIITPKWIVWQIQDEGKGLENNSRKGSLPKEIDSQDGRGLFLIYQCFDDVRWSHKGNRIQIACKRI